MARGGGTGERGRGREGEREGEREQMVEGGWWHFSRHLYSWLDDWSRLPHSFIKNRHKLPATLLHAPLCSRYNDLSGELRGRDHNIVDAVGDALGNLWRYMADKCRRPYSYLCGLSSDLDSTSSNLDGPARNSAYCLDCDFCAIRTILCLGLYQPRRFSHHSRTKSTAGTVC